MKKLTKIIKIISLVAVAGFSFCLVFCAGYFYISTKGIALNKQKLEDSITKTNLQIFDKNKNLILPSSQNFISIKKLSANTKDAFISAEDKRFYSHGGVDYLRVGGAIVSNIKNHSFSQGASTISQQLIKNTQLSSEKTIKRKLKEIKLTRKLEKNYSKDQILEMYLNNIYFGNGCYGVENASRHYFNKSASGLTLAESALLAGTINAPSVYNIETHQNAALSRRNLILDLMKKYKKITNSECEKAKKEPLKLNVTKLQNNNFLYNEILEEASKKLGVTENYLKNQNIKIYTNLNNNLSKQISEKVQNISNSLQNNYNIASIVIENCTNKITSIIGNKQTISSKKQPGSTIKPILVYAPAFEKGTISPATKLLDEKINIGGYHPENADKKFHGYVSVRESLKNSYNIPAVKLLNEIGIKPAQEFAKKLNIKFKDSDNNLAIALGGFTDGLSLKTLADAYCAFANCGHFKESSYITKIENEKGKIIYKENLEKTKVMGESTAYLITDILKDCSKTGTAKRLKDFDFEIASKTGTVGEYGSKLNSDAFNICYTSEHTIISYVGGKNMNESINGATYPTLISKEILLCLYENHKPKNFNTPNSIATIALDADSYKNNVIAESSSENSITEIFSKNNLPQKTESIAKINFDIINKEGQKPILCFQSNKSYSYKIFRKQKNKEELISSLQNLNKSSIIYIEDKNAKNNQIYEYFIEIYDNNENFLHKTKSVKLKTFNL